MRKRDVVGAAALAVGLGLAAEKMIDTSKSRGLKSEDASATERILEKKPESKTNKYVVETQGTSNVGVPENDAGGFGGDESEIDKKISLGELESAVARAIPGINLSSKKETNKRFKVGDYDLGFPDEKGNYTIRQFTEVKEFKDGTEFQYRDVMTLEPQSDGTIILSYSGQENVSCDLDSLPNVLRENLDFWSLILGNPDDFEERVFAGNMEYNEKASVDDLMRAQRFYESKIRDHMEIISREWQYAPVDEDQKTHSRHVIEEWNRMIVELQRRITQLTQ